MSDSFNEDFLISAPDYASVLNNTVLPALQERREDRTVSGKGGVPLYCSLFRAEHPVKTGNALEP